MLINSFEHTVDAKGRLFIPAKWREDLGNTVIVTRGMLGKDEGRCLFGMSLDVWNGLLERYNKIAMTDVKAQNALRMIFANACDCELDKQGRILISNTLRKFAGIDKDAVLVGMGNRIEIWSQEAWEAKLEQSEEAVDENEALSYLAGLGI
ncbi:MAG: division/cell wall cluster transcriptional repressor MraZ [Clostridia bacterium]|nr:division/cell wall cluster transcriptional repressor MraZ [Clostridia bacterium]MBQ7112764.1 division/cell wall cluster transcriptional repressor MraZ [Clostridia bacterium]